MVPRDTVCIEALELVFRTCPPVFVEIIPIHVLSLAIQSRNPDNFCLWPCVDVVFDVHVMAQVTRNEMDAAQSIKLVAHRVLQLYRVEEKCSVVV